MNKPSTWWKLLLIVALGSLFLIGPLALALSKNFSASPLLCVIVAASVSVGLAVLKPLVNYVMKSDE